MSLRRLCFPLVRWPDLIRPSGPIRGWVFLLALVIACWVTPTLLSQVDQQPPPPAANEPPPVQRAPNDKPPHGPPPDGQPPNGGPDRKGEGKVRKLDSLKEWREADDQLLLSVQKFVELNQRKQEVQEQMSKAKGRFVPGDVSPSAIIVRKQMAAIQSKYNDLLKDGEQLRSSVGGWMRRAYGSRRELRELLEARKTELAKTPAESRSTQDSYELERIDKWLSGLRRGEGKASRPLLHGIVGDEIGREMMQAFGPMIYEPQRNNPMPPPPGEEIRPPGPPQPDAQNPGGPPRIPDGSGPQGPPPDESVMERLDRLEKENGRLQNAVQRLRRDVEKLREQAGSQSIEVKPH